MIAMQYFAILLISLAFVLGLSLTSVQAISPFTEIGNLEMQVLDAINDVVNSLNAEIIRITSLNSTMTTMLTEVYTAGINATSRIDTNENAIGTLNNTKLDAALLMRKQLVDSNDNDCETNTNFNGWCPGGTRTWFVIDDSNVTITSFVGVSTRTDNFVGATLQDRCDVVDVREGQFVVSCLSVPENEAKLNYVVIQP